MIQDAVVVFVPENKYFSLFVISGGTYIVNDKYNTSLNDHFNFSVTELEYMTVY